MRYTIALQDTAAPKVAIRAAAGLVIFNGQALLPFEAAMLADALSTCADRAEDLAAEAASQLSPLVTQ